MALVKDLIFKEFQIFNRDPAHPAQWTHVKILKANHEYDDADPDEDMGTFEHWYPHGTEYSRATIAQAQSKMPAWLYNALIAN